MNRSKPFWAKWCVVAFVLAMCSLGTAYLFSQSKWKIKQEVQEQAHDTNDQSGTDEVKEQTRVAKIRYSSGIEYDLSVGIFKSGDTVESVMQKHPDLIHEESGRWSLINTSLGPAFASTTITAKDGRLFRANHHSCTFSETFFDKKLSQEEITDIEKAFKSIDEKRDEKRRTRNTLFVALTGVAARVQFSTYKQDNDDFYFPDLIDSSKE